MLLCFGGRAFVDQQIAEIDVGVAQVVAEDGLAEMLEEQLSGRRLLVELSALMAGTVERDGRVRVVRHQSTEERRQQAEPVFDETRDDLLRVERRRLLAEIDVAVDLTQSADHREVGDLMRIGERPQWRVESERAHVCREASRTFASIAVDAGDVRANRRIFVHIAFESIGHLDLEVLRTDQLDQFLRLHIRRIDDRDDLQHPVKRNRNRGCFYGARNHRRVPRLPGDCCAALFFRHCMYNTPSRFSAPWVS